MLLLAGVPNQPIYQILFASFAFILGSCIGSFLNVCIYRMPRGLSVNEPKRSFCPSCKYQIPWSSNLPLITWVIQGGKCRNCGARISVRYFLVELLTGLLFLAVWWRVSAGFTVPVSLEATLFFPLAICVSMLVVATFIDFEFLEIPDEITKGGTVVGIILSLILPQMQGEKWGALMGHLRAGAWSAAGAAIGFALLWLVSTLGKAAFGKKTKEFKPATAFDWVHKDDAAHLVLAAGETTGNKEDQRAWDEFFSSEDDVMYMDCERFTIEGETRENVEVQTRYLKLTLDGKEYDLEKTESFSGVLRKISFKREAMGFGDVKFIACIGAFLGWKAVLFTVMAASCIGAVVGGLPLLLGRLVGRKDWSVRIPFGPYLSLGALLWIFAGPELVGWYLSLNAADPAGLQP